MRREGFELQVSQPQVIVKEVDGVKCEPFEEVTIDVPSESQGVVIQKLGARGALMTNMSQTHNMIRMIFEGPTRGLLGYRSQFVVDTKGEGIMARRSGIRLRIFRSAARCILVRRRKYTKEWSLETQQEAKKCR